MALYTLKELFEGISDIVKDINCVLITTQAKIEKLEKENAEIKARLYSHEKVEILTGKFCRIIQIHGPREELEKNMQPNQIGIEDDTGRFCWKDKDGGYHFINAVGQP